MKKTFLAASLFLISNFSVAHADVGLRRVFCYADDGLQWPTYTGPYYVVSQDSRQAVLRDILRIENGRCVLSEPMTLPEAWCRAVTTEVLSNPPCEP